MHPPGPETWDGPDKPPPMRKFINSSDGIDDDIADRQAARVCKLYFVSFELAATIANLAWGIGR